MIVRFFITIFILSLSNLTAGIIHIPKDYRTIQPGIDAANTGDTILVNRGLYNENIDFHGKQLIVASRFLINRDTSYITDTVIEGSGDTSVVSIQNNEPEGTMLVGFSIRNGLGKGDFPDIRGGGVHISNNARPTIRYCYIYNNSTTGGSNRGSGVYSLTSKSVISNCRIYNNTSANGVIWIGNGSNGTVVDSCIIFNNDHGGIWVTYASNITISHCLIYSNETWGVYAYRSGLSLINNTIANNNGYGITHYGHNISDSLKIINTILYNNTNSFDFDEESQVSARYSLIQSGNGKGWFGSGCLDTDPLFENLTTYALTENSPAIDSGDPAMPKDQDSTIADMGAVSFSHISSLNSRNTNLSGFKLQQNYPNPFNPSTTISYRLAANSNVYLVVYDLLGREVKTLVNTKQPAGQYNIMFDASNLPSGFYFYRLWAGQDVLTKKMLLVR